MCFQIPTLISCNTRRHRHQGRNRNPSNLLYPPSSLSSQVLVHGGLWNCHSAVLKADFITALASAQSLDFLALTETWITPENSATPAALSSAFAFSHSPWPTGRGGGTGLLLSRKWSFTVLSFLHLDISSFEFHAVTISFPVKLHIIVLYRPPGPLGNFIDELDTLLSGLPVESSLILLGDFNLPSEKLQSSCLLPLLSSFSLSLNLSAPTHRAGNTLDLVFSRPAPALDLTVTPLDFSDHHFLSFTLSLPALPTNTTSSISTTHCNLRAISPSSLASTILTTLPNPDSFSSLPLETATNTFLSSITSSINTLSPLTSRPAKSSPATPWLSDVLRNNRRELRLAERKWKKSQQYSDLCSYQSLLSRFSTEVTAAKSSFYKRKLEESASDPRKLFTIFSPLLNPPTPQPPTTLSPDDFVNFFEEIVANIRQSFPPASTLHTKLCLPHSTSLSHFSLLSTDEILHLLHSNNPTTCPLDPLPSSLFQTIAPDLLPFITHIINTSSGHVPSTFKTARVVPILKKSTLDSLDVGNYRPVSLLSFLSKVLERAVYNQLSLFLTQNNLQDPNQSGFKPAHSTETALIAVTEKLHAAKATNLSSVLILLDLSAAFDTVNHSTLLSILTSLGIIGSAWQWFASYLEDRSYQVTWQGATSAPCRLSTGVPQGSVLGPLLFSLYTRSLGEIISSHGFSYHCYADDTQLILSFPPSDTQVSSRISACLNVDEFSSPKTQPQQD
uniref:Reverse transcriptase domain-containing protein n=1 Tax=Astyanax mexicanus TaxID=7994 RepID=A0A3B1IPZ4_ASTMX